MERASEQKEELASASLSATTTTIVRDRPPATPPTAWQDEKSSSGLTGGSVEPGGAAPASERDPGWRGGIAAEAALNLKIASLGTWLSISAVVGEDDAHAAVAPPPLLLPPPLAPGESRSQSSTIGCKRLGEHERLSAITLLSHAERDRFRPSMSREPMGAAFPFPWGETA